MLWWTLRELKADDWRKREGAARKLGESDDPRTIGALLATLEDKNPHVRKAAVETLARIGSLAVSPLITALKSSHAAVRKGAEDALVKIGNPAVTALGLALHDHDLATREAAASILGRIGDAAALEELLVAVKRGDYGVKEASAAGLVRMGSVAVNSLVAALKNNKARVRETAAAALVRIGRPAIEPLVAALKDKDVREAATEALWKIDPNWAKSDAARDVVPTFVNTLKEGDERGRKAAATVLGEVGNTEAFESMLAALADEKETVQEAAANALGQMGEPRAFRPLIRILQEGGTKARRAAAAALVQIGGKLVEPLVEALKDASPAVREAAAAVCVKIGHSAVEPLATVLWQIDPEWAKADEAKSGTTGFVAALKAGAAKSSQSLSAASKTPSASPKVTTLIDPIKGRMSAVRPIVRASGEPNDATNLKALEDGLGESNPEIRAAAVSGLLQMGNTAEEPLVAALRNRNQSLRRAAAHALAAAGDARGRDVLRADLSHSSRVVLLDAAESLVRLADVTVMKVLFRFMIAFYDAPPESGSADAQQAKRVFGLLHTLLRQHAEAMLIEDLHAITHHQVRRPPKFVSSSEAGVGPASAEQNHPILPGSDGEVDYLKLKELARRELNRRSHKA